jgi:hypothetical protein
MLRKNFLLRVLKGCWIMIFLVLQIKIDTTKEDLVLNLKSEWMKDMNAENI